MCIVLGVVQLAVGRDPRLVSPVYLSVQHSAIWTGGMRCRCTTPPLYPGHVRTVIKLPRPFDLLLRVSRGHHRINPYFLSTMDHEKLQAVVPQIFEYDGPSSTASPEPFTIRGPSIDEPVYVEDRRDRRGESVWYEGSQT